MLNADLENENLVAHLCTDEGISFKRAALWTRRDSVERRTT